jgi:hypothetical protein
VRSSSKAAIAAAAAKAAASRYRAGFWFCHAFRYLQLDLQELWKAVVNVFRQAVDLRVSLFIFFKDDGQRTGKVGRGGVGCFILLPPQASRV